MRLLLDTHVALWWLADDPRLPLDIREHLDSDPEVYLSAASVWEIAIKRALGKLSAPDDLPDHIATQGFGWLPIGPEHAWHVRDLRHHGDPFDRLVVAQALSEQIPIVSADARLRASGVETRW